MADVARHLGIQDQWAYDLETYDDDAPMTLSLGEVCDLAYLLAMSPRYLVCGEDWRRVAGTSSPQQIVGAIRTHLVAVSLSADEFGEAVGWDVGSVMDDPNRIWSDWNVDQAHEVCRAVGVDWRTLLPTSEHAV